MMSDHGMFDNAVQKSRDWIKEIKMKLYLHSEHEAYAAFRAVVHALRDRLTVEEAIGLGSHMPMLLRGCYYEGWDPKNKSIRGRSAEEFLQKVEDEFPFERMHKSPEEIVAGVFRVLEQRIGGETEEVKSHFHRDLRALWPLHNN
jgi:uncharacterized protein (DUF2267 family)